MLRVHHRIDAATKTLDKAGRRAVFERLESRMPRPATELEYGSPFELLVSVMLSAQATDVSVNKATAKLFARANTPAAMLRLGESGLKRYIKAIGLYNSKARNIVKTCRSLLDQFDGQVPRDRASLESLPGVGRKTANVILNTAFGEPTIAVDTHIFRVANRMGLAPGRTPFEVEKELVKFVPDEFKKNAHHWLILHGRYTCTARRPNCGDCILHDLCEWDEKGRYAKASEQTG